MQCSDCGFEHHWNRGRQRAFFAADWEPREQSGDFERGPRCWRIYRIHSNICRKELFIGIQGFTRCNGVERITCGAGEWNHTGSYRSKRNCRAAILPGETVLDHRLPARSLAISPNHFLFKISTVLFSTNSSNTRLIFLW